jgi:hypothetical protein
MTNPAIARIRTALPLVYTLGLWGEVLAFLFFSDPGGASPAICGCAEKLPQEGGRQKEKPPTGRKSPARASPIDHYNHALSKFGDAFEAVDQAFEAVSKVAGDNA